MFAILLLVQSFFVHNLCINSCLKYAKCIHSYKHSKIEVLRHLFGDAKVFKAV